MQDKRWRLSVTLIAGWITNDNHGPSSSYILSDSRISWPGNLGYYDYAKKVFSIEYTPDILGYCGNVLFPSMILQQIEILINNQLLFDSNAESGERSEIIYNQIKEHYDRYPMSQKTGISIFHISRDSKGNSSKFYVFEYSYDKTTETWSRNKSSSMDDCYTPLAFCAGSGRDAYLKEYLEYQKGNNQRTSRNPFQCFCKYLSETKDDSVGGPPQLAGLFRTNQGMPFGIVWNDQRFMFGSRINGNSKLDYNKVRWFNSNMERCDGNTMAILQGAKRQPDPNIIKQE